MSYTNSESGMWLFFVAWPWLIRKIRSRLFALLLHAPGISIGARSTIRGTRFIAFGRDVDLNDLIWIEANAKYRQMRFTPRIDIGDGVGMSRGVHITCIRSVIIGKNVLIGSGVYISDHNHGSYKGDVQSSPEIAPVDRELHGGPVDIGENVWIGDNAVIVGPLVIGRGAVVGANSVVLSDVPENSIVAGVPAKVIKVYRGESEGWTRV